MSQESWLGRFGAAELRSACKLAAVYFVVGATWILLSDRLLGFLVSDAHEYARFQTWKGWFYVAVTSILFGAVAFRELERLAGIQEREGERNRRYRMVFETAIEGILTLDADHRIMYANPAACILSGRELPDLVGHRLSEFAAPEDAFSPACFEAELAGLAEQRSFRGEFPLARPGGRLWCEIAMNALVDEKGAFFGSHALLLDIQGRRDHEASLADSLKEKEILLRELSHRVKNNLQLVESFISLRTEDLGDSRASAYLVQFLSRIRAMALVHERLVVTPELPVIDLDGLVIDLAMEFVSLYNERDIHLSFGTIAPISIDADKAVPVALAVNEAMLNAILHAYPEGDRADIFIEVKMDGDTASVVVADQGRGFEPALARRPSSGIAIMEGLAAQAKGSIRFEGGPGQGTKFYLTMPVFAAGAKTPPAKS